MQAKSLLFILFYNNNLLLAIELLREIRDEIGDWVQDFNYFMNGKANTLTITDCCELVGDDEDGCCDLEGTNGDCCSSTDSAEDKKSNK